MTRDMEWLTNYNNKQRRGVEEAAHIAGFSCYEIKEAYDVFGNLLDGYFGLYIPKEMSAEEKKALELFGQAYYLLIENITKHFHKQIPFYNFPEVYLGITEKEMEALEVK